MTAAQQVCEKALSLVGQGYIYGAKGQTCSPAFRRQQAQQYPDQADTILSTGAKWDGKPVWDCAQLTRAAAKAAGFVLVSGATSQWNKTDWLNRGTIDTLPEGAAAFLYRQANGKMQHTGVALGDGTCVHARGTAYGVVRQSMAQHAWTHWAVLWQAEQEEKNLSETAQVWAQSGSTVNVRTEPGGRVIERLSIGTQVEITARSAGWAAIRYDGGEGYMQSAFLREADLNKQVEALAEKVSALEERLAKAGL